jgi:hypothetical protein
MKTSGSLCHGGLGAIRQDAGQESSSILRASSAEGNADGFYLISFRSALVGAG